MTSRERVIRTIQHEKADRVPVYGWVSANLTPQITEAYGSVEAFEDHYSFDYAHLFGGPPAYDPETLQAMRLDLGRSITPVDALDLAMHDPDNLDDYANIMEQVCHHQEERERFVYVQTPGIFEALNGVFGIENHLLYLLMYPAELNAVYERQASWNQAFAMNCLDLGVDMIHVSDDWGGQHSLLFSTDTWWSLIYPNHKSTVDAVKARGAFVSLHSDGCVNAVLDGIVDLGYDVVHPWQESADMDAKLYRRQYADKFAIMGGLDVQTTIGFDDFGRLESEIRRVLADCKQGSRLFCTSHFVQDHCSMEELTFAYDLVREIVGPEA